MKSWIFLLASGVSVFAASHELVKSSFSDSAANRWANKKVLESRVLDAMDSLAPWTAFTTGAPEVVDARTTQKTTESSHVAAEIALSQER